MNNILDEIADSLKRIELRVYNLEVKTKKQEDKDFTIYTNPFKVGDNVVFSEKGTEFFGEYKNICYPKDYLVVHKIDRNSVVFEGDYRTWYHDYFKAYVEPKPINPFDVGDFVTFKDGTRPTNNSFIAYRKIVAIICNQIRFEGCHTWYHWTHFRK